MIEKGNVQVFPKQFILECENLKIVSDGTPSHTKIYVDGMEARGIYSVKINFNSQRPMKLELGVYTKWFTFNLKQRDQKDIGGNVNDKHQGHNS